MEPMTAIQLTLSKFDPDGVPLCHGNPDLCRFISICLHCSHSFRSRKGVRCRLTGRLVKARTKYQLRDWKNLRQHVMARDGESCVICGMDDRLHVHHIDHDARNDHKTNLVTLCGSCHSRVHSITGIDNTGQNLSLYLSRAVAANQGKYDP